VRFQRERLNTVQAKPLFEGGRGLSTDLTELVRSVGSTAYQLKKLTTLVDKPASYSRKLVQLTIIKVDVLLEWLKLSIIHKMDHNINCVQHWLFLLSMAIDRGFQK
jgi:hypothetical protein